MLKRTFYNLCLDYSSNVNLANQLWKEIELNYSNSSRFYHTLKHLENMLEEISSLSLSEHDSKVFKFSLFYHDIIYNPSSKDNEQKSAKLAKLSLFKINVPSHIVDDVYSLILLTKSHKNTNNHLFRLFLDTDISILGSSEETYSEYIKNIRKEYKIYNDKEYFIGRKKIVKHFLNSDNIFQTEHFRDIYEKQAKLNLTNELSLLKGTSKNPIHPQ